MWGISYLMWRRLKMKSNEVFLVLLLNQNLLVSTNNFISLLVIWCIVFQELKLKKKKKNYWCWIEFKKIIKRWKQKSQKVSLSQSGIDKAFFIFDTRLGSVFTASSTVWFTHCSKPVTASFLVFCSFAASNLSWQATSDLFNFSYIHQLQRNTKLNQLVMSSDQTKCDYPQKTTTSTIPHWKFQTSITKPFALHHL